MIKEELNVQQQRAVDHIDGPMLVIAGAGSGKTRVVTYRIVHLLEIGVPSSEIVAVTFTNKAAAEMRERIHRKSQKAVLTCTFHSLCASILRESIEHLGYQNNFTIFDEDDSEKVLKEVLKERSLKEDRAFHKSTRGAISHAKNHLIDPSVLKKEDEQIGLIYEQYQAKLKMYNALDFDDLLYLTVKLFQQEPEVLAHYQKRWRFILIDEYQDTNQAQYMLIKLLSAKHQNVFAVGDPDQSIYSWRGANVENILNFEKDYPGATVLSLEQNYRSTSIILKGANAMIDNNDSRYEKNLWSDRGEGEKIGLCLCESERDEVTFVLERLFNHHTHRQTPLKDCVIFYRTHFQSRVFEDALLKENIPYLIVGGVSFYQRREIKDVLGFLRIAHQGTDFLSFARTINLPKRGIGPATIAKIQTHAYEMKGDLIACCQGIIDGRVPLKLSAKQLQSLRDYVEIILEIRSLVQSDLPIHILLERAIEIARYVSFLKQDPETLGDRKGNIDELISKALEWGEENDSTDLSHFLEELSLKSHHDDLQDDDCVRLMTLHNGKGLEFSVCFLVGMEEELFPHANSLGDFQALEEERRLCYVGMTRAKNSLYMTAARMRYLWGTLRPMRPSRFLSEIPEEYVEKYHKESFSAYAEDSGNEEFHPGNHVAHRDFGRGIIQKVYQTSLGTTYDILFEDQATTRSLVAKYAKLQASS